MQVSRISSQVFRCNAYSEALHRPAKVFTGYFGCTVVKRQGNRFKVSPPQPGQGIWHWERVPFFIHKVYILCITY